MDSTCWGLSSTPEKMNAVPIRTPVIEPRGLNACAKLRRLSELSGLPNCAMKGLDAVSRNDNPLAMMNRASRKKAYRLQRIHHKMSCCGTNRETCFQATSLLRYFARS